MGDATGGGSWSSGRRPGMGRLLAAMVLGPLAMPLDLMARLDPLRRVRCPFCFERFAACEMHLRCNDHYCKTDFARMVDDPILSRALDGRGVGGARPASRRPPGGGAGPSQPRRQARAGPGSGRESS